MTLEDLTKFVQEHFTDGLVLVVGSGLSSAEGIPGMLELAEHLKNRSSILTGGDAGLWTTIANALENGEGLEAALLKTPPTESLEAWIAKNTCQFLLPKEREIIAGAIRGERILRLTMLLGKILKPSNGLPILTPNYDRLIEVACELAGFHVDTTAIGQYAGGFDYKRSCMGSCRGILMRGRTTVLDHFPRAIVLKPHGSLDWYRTDRGPIRGSIDLELERLIITPGLNKYKAGYSAPFDKQRDLANDYVDQAARFLIVGYGFNDDHLQPHLIKRIQDGVPTLIVTRDASPKALEVVATSSRTVCLSKPSTGEGVIAISNGTRNEHQGKPLWDLGTMTQEIWP